MKNFFLLLFGLIIGIGLVVMFHSGKQTITHQTSRKPLETHFSFANAPSTSVRGTLLSFSGDVEWRSRTASESVQLTTRQDLQQGESLEITASGSAKVEFPNIATIALSPATEINFVQTLPQITLFQQRQGTATYTKTGTQTPINVRALSLLTNISSGASVISVDNDQAIITIHVLSGQATVGYNDANYISTVVTIAQGGKFVFDNTAREYTMN